MKILIDNKIQAEITIDHTVSSYGKPVVMFGKTAYGPADLITYNHRQLLPCETEEDLIIIKKFFDQTPNILYCYRCGYIWVSRSFNRPGACPRCKSAAWYRPREENEPGPKPKRLIKVH